MELKETIESIGRAFEQFKAENDARLKEIEKKGHHIAVNHPMPDRCQDHRIGK